jgi:hypothetical protein
MEFIFGILKVQKQNTIMAGEVSFFFSPPISAFLFFPFPRMLFFHNKSRCQIDHRLPITSIFKTCHSSQKINLFFLRDKFAQNLHDGIAA